MAEYITFNLVVGGTKVLPCVPRMLTEADRLTGGGFEHRIIFAVNIRTSYFVTSDSTEITVDSIVFTADDDSPPPRANGLGTFRGRSFRVFSVGEDATRAFVHVVLEDPNV